MRTKKSADNLYLIDSGYTRVTTKAGELREVLKVASKLPKNALEQDVKNGASPFFQMAGAEAKDFAARVSVIRSKRLEEGLMAVNYLAAKHNAADIIDCNDDTEDDCFVPDADEWCNNDSMYPIIRAEEVNLRSNSGYPLSGGEMSFLGQSFLVPATPYWSEQDTSPVIIVYNSNYFMPENNMVDIVRMFDRNRRVYIIEFNRFDFIGEDDEVGSIPTILLQVILEKDASLFVIDTEKEEEYFCKLFISLMNDKKLKCEPEFESMVFINELFKVLYSNESMRLNVMDKLMVRTKKRNGGRIDNKIMTLLSGTFSEKQKEQVTGWELLDSMVGLESAKDSIRDLIAGYKMAKYKRARGIKVPYPAALMLVGPAGSGKTSIARAIGQILKNEGVFNTKGMTETTGAGLCGEFLGATRPKVQNLFNYGDEGAKPAVVFIDEAYSLTEGVERNLYARDALSELCIQLERISEEGEQICIFAGYGGANSSADNNKMLQFAESNPGIKSRISSVINFDPLSAQELLKVYLSINEKCRYELAEPEKSLPELVSFFESVQADEAMGGGRLARQLAVETQSLYARRLYDSQELDGSNAADVSLLQHSDVVRAIEKYRKQQLYREGLSNKKSVIGFSCD